MKCGGDRCAVVSLLREPARSSGTATFSSELEHLFFRAALFDVKCNIVSDEACSNHLAHIRQGEKHKRCKFCKPLFGPKEPQSTLGLRKSSKAMALLVWRKGQPLERFAVFDQWCCTRCRSTCESDPSFDATVKESNEVFGKYRFP